MDTGNYRVKVIFFLLNSLKYSQLFALNTNHCNSESFYFLTDQAAFVWREPEKLWDRTVNSPSVVLLVILQDKPRLTEPTSLGKVSDDYEDKSCCY